MSFRCFGSSSQIPAKMMRIVLGEWIKSTETSRMISSRHRGDYSSAVQSWPQKLRYLLTQ